MGTEIKYCSNESELAAGCLFLFERKRDLHPSILTTDMLAILYEYATRGHMVLAIDNGQVAAAAVYYLGTPEREFADTDTALIDIAIIDKPRRKTRLFARGLHQLVRHIADAHPHVRRLQLAALKENRYLCAMYKKFTSTCNEFDSELGPKLMFGGDLADISASLARYNLL